jgi:hypothetical protein
VDPAPYALRLADAWAYRGPLELSQHPDLGSADNRLFVAGGRGRDDGSWSDRPLLAVERPDGLSLLMVLHTKGDLAVVTTTWQRQDESPRQSEQEVADGQLLVQSFVPSTTGGLLVALASPGAGSVETDLRGAQQLVDDRGLGVWQLPGTSPAGSVLLYGGPEGLLYHSEPARRS